MHRLFFLLLALFYGFISHAQPVEDNLKWLDSLLIKHKNMHFYRSHTLGSSDSVWHKGERFYLYFDTDSICRQFVRKGGYNAIPDEMDYLYYSIFTEMKPERRALEIEKMEKIAQHLRSEQLMREVELQKIMRLPHSDSEENFEYKMKSLRELLDKAIKRKDTLIEIRIRETILVMYQFENHTFNALEEVVGLTKILGNISEKQYAGYRALCFFIAETYYKYGYYEQAVPLLKKILKDATHFYDRTNLRARNTLGLFYRNTGDLELSDNYFRSMLESSDEVYLRGEYDAIAICNLGKNYLLRKEYRKAEQLLKKGLEVMRRFDPVFSVNVYINLGNCYLSTGRYKQTKAMIDSAQKIINAHRTLTDLNSNFYPLLSKYYAAIGNLKASMAYSDSTVDQHLAYQKKYNTSHIFQIEKLQVEAEKRAAEKQLKEEKMSKEKYRNILIGGLILIGLTVSFFYFYFRLRNLKNRFLYKRIMEQSRIQRELSEARQLLLQSSESQKENIENNHSNYKTDKNTLLQRLENLMTTEQLFADPDISRKILADRLATNENYLANAIREGHNGKSFSDYINALRLSYARRLLQENYESSIKEISIEAGFSSYKYFHQLFLEEFGMSPSLYRKYLTV